MRTYKDPFETLPVTPCNHVHVRYGACTLLYDHAGGHRWVNDRRRYWIAGAVWFGFALLIAALWIWSKLG